MTKQEVWQKVRQIVADYPLLECARCAASVMEWLRDNGIEGKILRLRTKRRSEVFIISDRYGSSESITENGTHSVSDLFMFIAGYEFARSEMDIELTEAEDRFYQEFQPWLQNKLGVRSVTSWAKLIMLSCHDEKIGFESFYRLLAEFRQSDEFLAKKSKSVICSNLEAN